MKVKEDGKCVQRVDTDKVLEARHQPEVKSNPSGNKPDAISSAARSQRKIVLEQLEAFKSLIYEVNDPANLSDISNCLEKLMVQVRTGGKTPNISNVSRNEEAEPAFNGDETSSCHGSRPTIKQSPWIRSTKKLYTPLLRWTKRRARRSLKGKLDKLAGTAVIYVYEHN